MLRNLPVIVAVSALLISGVALAEGHGERGTGQAEPAKKLTKAKKRCLPIRKGILYYREKTWQKQDVLGISRTKRSDQQVWSLGCKYAEWVRKLWKERNEDAKKKVEFRTLHDPGDWNTAIRVAQRVFPGTSEWLWSCSGAEGGHGRWVPYRDYGNSYYPGYESLDAVGGWMQFRPSTIRHAWPATYNYLIRHGWIVEDMSWFQAWFSPLAQALSAAYYLRVEGSADHHWSASVGSGC